MTTTTDTTTGTMRGVIQRRYGGPDISRSARTCRARPRATTRCWSACTPRGVDAGTPSCCHGRPCVRPSSGCCAPAAGPRPGPGRRGRAVGIGVTRFSPGDEV